MNSRPVIMISIIDLPKKQDHSHAHSLLSQCLRVRGIDYSEDALSYGEQGKPYLPGSDIHFNISHSSGIAACIVSGRECGIDCEAVKKYRPGVVRRVCSEKEKAMLEAVSEEERPQLFYRLWTLKEAYVKMLGIGISYPMAEAEFLFSGGKIITDLDCDFRQYILRRGKYIVSVCERMN